MSDWCDGFYMGNLLLVELRAMTGMVFRDSEPGPESVFI